MNDRAFAHEHLRELNAVVEATARQYEGFVRSRQEATHSYVGYDAAIGRLRQRVDAALAKVDRLQARQGHLIETVAIDVLQARRERLVSYQEQARFAVADSYDRATRQQTSEARP